MCGIAGILDRRGAGIPEPLIDAMVADLSHRGPDGQGTMLRGNVAFGHRRLSILDPEGGRQPMVNEDGEVWTTFNGEIYNFRELVRELEGRGHRFRTHCDTEVIVHAWEEWGERCVERFRGMFAFGVMDWRRGTVFLARDPFGIKPLHWILTPEAFAFASEFAPLRRVPGFRPEVDTASLDEYLWLQYVSAPRSGYAQIRKLPPARSLLVDLDGKVHEPREYWKMDFTPEEGLTREEWVERIDAAVEETVDAHLVSDVPFGAFLSGGVDSSLVVAKMTKVLGAPVDTFSIGNVDPDFDETAWAQIASRSTGSRSHFETIDVDALSLLPELVRHYGEPFADSSAIPTWHVARLARRHVPMVLSGDGADELFAGYWSHGNWMNGAGGRPGPHRLEDWIGHIKYMDTDLRRRLWLGKFDGICPTLPPAFATEWARTEGKHPLHRVQQMDVRTYLHSAILTKVDIASMMHGLEVRTPFVDVRLAEVACRVPAEFSMVRGADGSWDRKRVLKDIALRHFPREMLERPKMGFAIPVSKWFRPGTAVWHQVAERFLEAGSPLRGFFDEGGIRQVLQSGEGPHIWQLLFLDEWLRQLSAPAPKEASRAERIVTAPAAPAAKRPKVLIIADVPGWIFERHARTLQAGLAEEFDISIAYKGEPLDEDAWDLIYPLEWAQAPREARLPWKWVTGIRSHVSWEGYEVPSLCRFLETRFAAVHVVSRKLEAIFKPHLPSVVSMSHGLRCELFQADTEGLGENGRIRLGWAGNRATNVKGFDELIRPLGELPGVELRFCGYSDTLLTLEQMKGFYEEVDVYVCSSKSEGHNNSLMEAACMGRAIVTTDVGTVPEYLEDGVSALIVERTPQAIRAAVERLRDDASLRRRLGEAAKASVRRSFDWKDKLREHSIFLGNALTKARCAALEARPVAASRAEELLEGAERALARGEIGNGKRLLEEAHALTGEASLLVMIQSLNRHAESPEASPSRATAAPRVLLACTHFWPSRGGLEVSVEQLGKRLVQAGAQVDVSTGKHAGRTRFEHAGMGIREVPGDPMEAGRYDEYARSLQRDLESGSYDAVVLYASPGNWISLALSLATVPASTRVLVQPLVNADGRAFLERETAWRSVYLDALRKADGLCLLTSTGEDARFCREQGLDFRLIPNGAESPVEASRLPEVPELAGERPTIVHVANYWPEKNHPGLLEGMRSLPGDWRLLLVGRPGPDLAYNRLVDTLAARDPRVHQLKTMDAEGVSACLRKADVLVLSSRAEVAPLSLLEAMSHGVPWVATPTCGSAIELAGGLVVALEDFPATVRGLLGQPGMARALGESGRRLWASGFSWEAVSRAWEDALFGFGGIPALAARRDAAALVNDLAEHFEAMPTERDGEALLGEVAAALERKDMAAAKVLLEEARGVVETVLGPDSLGARNVRALETSLESMQAHEGADAQLAAADALWQEGRRDEALLVLEELAERCPKDREVARLLAWMQVEQGRLAQAQAQYARIVELDELDPRSHCDLAGILMRRDLKDRAIEHLHRALWLMPGDPEIHLALARLQQASGRREAAVDHWHRFLATSPAGHAGRALAKESLEILGAPAAWKPGFTFGLISNGVRGEKIRRLIRSVRAQGIEDVQILLCGIPPEGFDEPGVEVLHAPECAVPGTGGPGQLRNRVARAARHEVVVISDDDMVFHDGFCQAILDRGPDWDVLCPRMLNPDGTRHWDWAVFRGHGSADHYLLPYDAWDPDVYLPGGAGILKRTVFDRVLWREELGFGQYDDVIFSQDCSKADVRIGCLPGAVVTHDDPRHSEFFGEPLTMMNAVGFARDNYLGGNIERARGYLRQVHGLLPGSGYPVTLAVDLARSVGDIELLRELEAPAGFPVPLAAKEAATRPAVIGYDLRTLSDSQSHGRGIGHYALHHLEALLRRDSGLRIVAVIPGDVPDPAWAGRFEGLAVEWLPAARYAPGSFDLLHTPDPMGLQIDYDSPLSFFEEPRMSVLFHDLIPLRFYREALGVGWPAYLTRLELLKQSPARFLCNSEHTADELRGELGLEASSGRVSVVGAGLNREAAAGKACDPAALRARLGLKGDYCLYVGAMDPHKNFEGTLQAVLDANRERPVQLAVTGRPNAMGQMWIDKLRAAGIGDLVVFTGYLERAELDALYAGAVALVFLSRLEGFGFPALEAMAAGCAVVCSDAASLPEVVGDAALLHKLDDLSGATASILRLCRDRALRIELAAKGRARAAGFSWDRVAERTIAVWRQMLAQDSAPVDLRPRPVSQVNWVSPVFDPSGYASEARAFLLDLDARGMAPAVKAADRHSATFVRDLAEAPRQVLTKCLDRQWRNESPFVFVLPAPGFSRISGQPHVGRTTFETDGLPADWIAKCNAMDEIWVPSQFNLETFRAAGVKVPLLRVPEGVDTERFRPGLAPLELPGERRGTTFLSVFEWTHRKGWDVLLAAWADAFKAGDDVELVLRAYPANAVEGDPAQWVEDRICQFLSSRGTSREACAPITVLAAQIPEGDMPRLYAAADVYLAPSRGEGWGRPHMEAMSAGLPVIATRWSGNLDFMDDSNSWLLDVEALEEIDIREEFEFYRGQKWARPSTDHLAGLMRRAAASPDGRRALGEKARADMVARWDWKKIAPLAALRLEEIRAGVPAERSRLAEVAPVPCCLAVTDNVEARRRPVRWCGPLFNASGHARQGREAVLGLTEIGVPVSLDPLFNEQSFLEGLEQDEPAARRWGRLVQNPPKSGVLVCCDLPTDGGGLLDVYEQARRRSPEQKACVAWCTFEADRLPEGWAAKLRGVDEVWVPSTFNREVFAKAGVPAERLFVVPEGIDPGPYRAATPRVLPEAAGYTFLSVFQWSLRKGWDVLLEAWAKAFAPEDDVQLVLRCSPFSGNAAPIQEQAEAFLRSRGLSWESMAPVVLLADPLPEREMPGLYAACDCFVLPSRGEGWGLPYLEAMAAGRPCIATAWAGPLDFLHEGNAWLVPPEGLVPPSEEALLENPFLSADQRWAGLSVEAFAKALRHAKEHRDEGRAKGARGRADVRERWTPVHTAHAMLERLKLLPRESAAIAQEGLRDAMLGQELSNSEGTERNMAETPLHVRWEGSQFVHHSLAHINREVCLELALRGHDMALQPYEPDEFRPEPGSRLAPLAQLVLAPLEESAQVHVRHQWPPQLVAPEEGRWVAIQPWEFGPVPKAWVEAWKEDLDELWVPSQFVKGGYVQSGMPAERVAVIPNGVDADRFRPHAKPLDIPSPKSFRFLFVGGTIYRKGIDILLTAYERAFRDTDDVTLVVKDMGGKTFYRGQTADDLFERFGSRPGNPELIVIDEPLSDEELPGLYGACTCLVHPYRGEGFGMPILEAMSAGLPVIVTDGGPAKEFCSPDSAWFVPAVRKDLPGRSIGEMECAGQPWLLEPDVEALARLMRAAYEDRTGCKAKGARGREAVLAGYTWGHMADRVEARLEELVKHPRRRKALLQPAKNLLDPSLRNTQVDGDDQELNLLLMQIEPALGRGDVDEARDLVNEAVERFPGHPLSWLTRAMLQRGAGKAVQGLADAERSIQCRETPEALQEAIECYLALKRQADAERLLKRLEREYPQWCATARLGLGRPWIGGKVRHGGSGGHAKPKAAKKARK